MYFNIKDGGDFILRSIAAETAEAPDPFLRWEADVISRVAEERLIVSYTIFRKEIKVQQLIGKFYAAYVGGRAYQAMSALQKELALEGDRTILAAPKPLFYNKKRELIVQEFVEGVPYYDLIEREGVSFYFHEAGKALAALHHLKITHGERRLIEDHLEELIHPHPLLFADIMKNYYPCVQGIIEELMRIEASWKTIETVPIHRDFHLRQLFHDEKQVWLIDWDLLAMGDPALDVGNFIVYLETRLKENHTELIKAFLEGYFLDFPLNRRTDMENRVFLYKAFTYLRLACKSFRLKPEGWEAKLKKMLLRSEECLFEISGNTFCRCL